MNNSLLMKRELYLFTGILQDEEDDECCDQQDCDLHAWAHEPGAAPAVFRVGSVAAAGVIISSWHNVSFENRNDWTALLFFLRGRGA